MIIIRGCCDMCFSISHFRCAVLPKSRICQHFLTLTVPSPQPPVTGPYNLQKRNWNQENEPNNRIAKRTRAMLALLEQEEFDLNDQETAFAVSEKTKEIIWVPIPNSYSMAVTDPMYGPDWRAAIQEEIA